MQLGVNHIGHFALTAGLLECVEKAQGRVVTVSSAAHLGATGIDPNVDLHRFTGNSDDGSIDYSPWGAYFKSKLANVLFTKELQKRLDVVGSAVSATCLHPGAVRTELGRYLIEGAPLPLLALAAPVLSHN